MKPTREAGNLSSPWPALDFFRNRLLLSLSTLKDYRFGVERNNEPIAFELLKNSFCGETSANSGLAALHRLLIRCQVSCKYLSFAASRRAETQCS